MGHTWVRHGVTNATRPMRAEVHFMFASLQETEDREKIGLDDGIEAEDDRNV